MMVGIWLFTSRWQMKYIYHFRKSFSIKRQLVAEIASCFSAADLGLDGNSIQFDNHTAYIQSWVSHIKEKPEALMAAIKEADKAADYLINSLEFKQEENRLQEKEYEEELEM